MIRLIIRYNSYKKRKGAMENHLQRIQETLSGVENACTSLRAD